MNISVCLVSRSNPLALIGVVMGLHRLASTVAGNTISYFIGADEDDPATIEAVKGLASINLPITISTGPRPIARGEVENRLLGLGLCRDAQADVVTFLTDRTFCISPAWDEYLARGVTEQPKRPLWWSSPQDPVCAIPIIPRAWLDALDWIWSPEVFPFWFDDTWHQQIDLLINGSPSLKVTANFSGQRGKTTRGRDFGFWIDCFHKLLPVRVEMAREMAGKLGVEWRDRPDVLAYIGSWYENMSKNVADLEKTFGDPREPGPEYTYAKARAEKMLAEMFAADMGVKNVA